MPLTNLNFRTKQRGILSFEFCLLYRALKSEEIAMLLIATTQTKVKSDIDQMVVDGFLDTKAVADLGDHAEIAAEALNDLYEALEFAMPASDNDGVKKYAEFRELAFEMLEYHAAVTDAMLALKKQCRSVVSQHNNVPLQQAV